MGGGGNLKLPVLINRLYQYTGLYCGRDGKMLWGVLDTSSFFISGLSFLFLMLVFISPQGLDLWRNKSDEDNSLEMRHCTELEEGKKDLFIVILAVGGQFVSPREILDRLSCWLLRNCCCKRLIKSWSSCSLVGNVEKEESHRTASSVGKTWMILHMQKWLEVSV